jgi:hypothetical protein
VCLIDKIINTEHNSTTQNKIVENRTILYRREIERQIDNTLFVIKMAILYFFYSCTMDKKLSCGLVRDKNYCFCHVSYGLFCPIS